MSRFEYKLKTEDSNKPLKAIVKEQFAFSSRLMSRLRRAGAIKVNGEAVPNWIGLKPGDVVTVDMPEERSEFPPEEMPLDVVYEDEHLLVINKQPGIVVHPTKGNPCHSLLNGLMYKILQEAADEEGNTDPDKVYKIRLVNRLDMNTSGLIVVAKNPYVQADLVKQMHSTMVKKYVALAEGIIKDNMGLINLPLGRPDENEVERWVVALEKGGQESLTRYKVLKRYDCPHSMVFGSEAAGGPIEEKIIDEYSLVELILDTGRTHQIRIHLAALGHPVVGDHLYCHGDPFLYREVYGDPRPPLTGEKGPRMDTNPEVVSEIMGRQALHAFSLDFIHPVTGKEMHLEADLPDDMKNALERISEPSGGN